jgi:enoyl-CoA hydratase
MRTAARLVSSAAPAAVRTETSPCGQVVTVLLQRPRARNAVDRATAHSLHAAFVAFERDDAAKVAVLHGLDGTFCAGADLKAMSEGMAAAGAANLVDEPRPIERMQPGPMGPTRLRLSKPVIAAVEGHAVAGGLELACWCDLRVCGAGAVFGVFCRRWGVPLVDGGTVRLPRLVGASRALDMILTGRPVAAEEALA